MDTLGFCQDVVGPLLKLKVDVGILDVHDVRNLGHDDEWIFNAELSQHLLWSIGSLLFERCLHQFNHLFHGILEVLLQLLESLEGACLPVFAGASLHRHGTQGKAALDHSLVVPGSQSKQLGRSSA